MQALTRDDLLTLERYSEERARLRAEVLEHKRNRQVARLEFVNEVFEIGQRFFEIECLGGSHVRYPFALCAAKLTPELTIVNDQGFATIDRLAPGQYS